jgi:hypothetical protein
MSKEQLISQVLNEKQIDLYLFWAMKLLTEYPEYKQKVIDNWRFLDINSEILEIYDNNVCSKNHYGYLFYYTASSDLEGNGFLNWTLKEEGYE